jgi:hypothetical protein
MAARCELEALSGCSKAMMSMIGKASAIVVLSCL